MLKFFKSCLWSIKDFIKRLINGEINFISDGTGVFYDPNKKK